MGAWTATTSPSAARRFSSTPANGLGNSNRDLVGHDLDDGLVLFDRFTLRDEPLDDFTFDHRLGEFGQ